MCPFRKQIHGAESDTDNNRAAAQMYTDGSLPMLHVDTNGGRRSRWGRNKGGGWKVRARDRSSRVGTHATARYHCALVPYLSTRVP
eukprot:SAG31_NODE_12_length_38498_cov_21.161671_28_plen_86_part_00